MVAVMSRTAWSYAGSELSVLAESKNYYQGIVSRFSPYVDKRIVEVGAGNSRLGLHPWPVRGLFERSLHFIAVLGEDAPYE